VPNTEYWDKAPHPQAGPAGADPDAGGVDPHRGIADRPGELDRSTLAGRHTAIEIRGHAHRHHVYPHDWPYMLNFARGPFKDLRVRRAANFAINRQDVVDMLGGTAIPEHDVVPPTLAYYGHPPTYTTIP